MPNLDRKELPHKLEALLGSLAQVRLVSDHYDPSRPNLYMIPQMHFDRESPDSEGAKIYPLQSKIVSIGHILYSLGLKRQFCEGIPRGNDIQHDKVDTTFSEDSARSMPEYKKTGKVRRAYIAIEGIYGSEISTVGAEGDYQKQIDVDVDFGKKEKNEFAQARLEILEGVAQELGIAVPGDKNTDPTYYTRLSHEIAKKVMHFSRETQAHLLDTYVLSNEKYRAFLESAVNRFYNRIQERDAEYIKTIEQDPSKVDTSFILGVGHFAHLEPLLKAVGYNVFFVIPQGIDQAQMSPYYSHYTKDDYFKNIVQNDLFNFGMGPKPKNYLQ